MAMFKTVAMAQLHMASMVFLLGSAFRALPTKPANDCGCGWGLYYRVVIVHHCLVGFAANVAFAVWTEVCDAEDAAARAGGTEAFHADRAGMRSVAPRWRRRWLRGKLLLAVLLSFAASVLAVVAFPDGSLYRTGCLAGVASGSLLGVLFMGFFALVHGFFAWAPVTQN